MRVLHVIPSVGPLRGGPSDHVRSLCAALVDMGAEVTLITTDDNGSGRLEVPLGRACDENGYTTFYFPRQISEYTVSLPLASWLRRNIASYHCLHAHAVFSFAPTVSTYYACKARVPYLLSTHGILQDWGFSNRRKYMKKLSLQFNEKWMMKRAYAVLLNSKSEMDESLLRTAVTNAVVIPHGLNVSEYKGAQTIKLLREKFPEIGDRKIALFMSRLHDIKGIDLLLRAWAMAGIEGAVLVIAGEGEERFTSRLKRLASALCVNAVWAGYLEKKEKIAALHEADLFVLPSWSESFGISVIEAMACGVPVLVSDRVGVSDDVSAAKAGMAVPCDAGRLADALSMLMANAQLRGRMGFEGERFAREKYDIRRIALEILRLYELAVGEKR